MTDNRRNYYRVLHVQPEAPLEVIRASYRTLMSTLRQHPDLGGDTAAAALLNEAYAVLKDPVRRAQYDANLVARRQRSAARAANQGAAAPKPPAQPAAAPDVVATPACPICRTALPVLIRTDTRCVRCEAPLAPPPAADQTATELFGRRGSARHGRDQMATMSVGWPPTHMAVRWRDLSLTGVSVHARQRLAPLQVVRIACADLDVVVQVVSCRRNVSTFTVHARLIAAIFMQTTGVFVSEKV